MQTSAFEVNWGSAPDWVVAITAVAGAIFAGRQLLLIGRSDNESAKAHQDQVEIERANLLLRLDEGYEGPALLESRRAWTQLRAKAERQASEAGDTTNETRAKAIGELVSRQLTQLWTQLQIDGD